MEFVEKKIWYNHPILNLNTIPMPSKHPLPQEELLVELKCLFLHYWDDRVEGSAICVGQNGKVRENRDFIFFNKLAEPDDPIRLVYDFPYPFFSFWTFCSLIPKWIWKLFPQKKIEIRYEFAVSLQEIPSDIHRILFSLSLLEPKEKNKNDTRITQVSLCMKSAKNNQELLRTRPSDNWERASSMIVGEMHRNGNTWAFETLAQGVNGGLGDLARSFGVNV